MRVIPSYDGARRIGFRAVENGEAIGYRVFQYEHPPSRLTLYGVALVQADGSQREVRYG